MEEQQLDPSKISPDVSLSGGLLDPGSLREVKLDLPEPPRSYPTGVRPGSFVPTQKDITPTSPTVDQANAFADALKQKLSNPQNFAKNPYHYGKVSAYNADYDGANFARYANVPRVFKKHGFSPYRNNEAIYDKEASWWDYYKRSVGASYDLAKSSFSESLPWNAWDGKRSDVEAAVQMQRGHAIGHDNRGGAGAWLNNMTTDSGYTMGILGEFAAEEISLFVGGKMIKAGPAGAVMSLGEIGAGTLRNIQKAYKGFTRADKIKDAYKYVSNTADWLKGGMKLSKFYDYAKSGAKFIGKQATPETANWLADMYKSGVGIRQGQLLVDLAKASKGFGAFYRDARLYSGVMSEAKVEGGSTELDVRDKLIDKYIATHDGRQPDEDALKEIYREAADAGKQTYLYNVPVLFLSNKIVFDKALRGFGPAAAFREELERGIAGKLRYNEAWKKAGGKAWEAVEEGFKDRVKSFKKSIFNPKGSFKNVIGRFATYTNANLSEGLQEMYQDAVSNTMKDYYVSNMYNDKVVGSRTFLGAFADNIGKSLTSKEGWSTFGSGFLMGSMVQFPQKLAFDIAPKKFSQIFDKENFQKARNEERQRTARIVDALNAATMTDNFWDSITENAGVQMNGQVEADRARAAGSKKAFYDISDEMVYNHVHTLMSTGKLPLLKDMIKDFKSLDKEALQEAFGPVPPGQKDDTYYADKLDSMSRKLKLIEDNVQDIENRFGNPYNPGFYDPQKNPIEHNFEISSYNAWEKAKKAAAFSKYSFERAVERMQSMTKHFAENNPFGNTAQSEFNMLLESDNIATEMKILKDEIETYKKGDIASQKIAASKEAYLDLLKDYKASLDIYLTSKQVNSYKEAGIKKDVTDEAERQATIQKGTVVRNKKGNENTVDTIKRGEAYNAKGEKIGKLKDLEIISTPVQEEEVSVLENAADNLRQAYTNIIKARAKERDIMVSDQSIEDTFREVLDYHDLKYDAKDMMQAVNMLHNPEGMLAYAKRYAIIEEEAKRQNKEFLENAYKKFSDSLTLNDLFVELYKMGVFLDEKGMDDVIEKRVPTDFYDIAKKERISENSKKYRDIMDLIEKYEQARDMEFEEKPIEESDNEDQGFSTARRNKINDDNRKFKDLAEQYGFDPDPNILSKVNTKQILKKIIDSKYATYREKALARRLLTVIKDDSEITFTKLPNPGVFGSLSLDKQASTHLDPRYMSKDYRGGTTPFEYVVLHELIHEVTMIEMYKDKEFSDNITRLLQIARNEFKTNPPTDTTLYNTATEQPFYGLKNEAEFLSELFTNDRFAMWLDTIKIEGTGKTTWQEFKDALRKFLKRLLGVSEDSSLLDEALYIATTFIDKTQLGVEPEAKTSKTTVPGGATILNLGSSIEDFQAAGILPNLINAYKDFVKTQIGPDRTSASEWPDAFALEKTDEEIKNSKYFRDFLNLGLTSAAKIISDYNQTVSAKKATRPSPQQKTPTPDLITDEVYNAFVDNNIVPESILESIADKVIKKDTLSERETAIFNGKTSEINDIIVRKASSTSGKKAPARTGTGPKASISQKRILNRDLGYTDWVELNNMSEAEAQRLIDGNIIKSKRDQESSRLAEEEARQAALSKEESIKNVEDMIARADFKSEIEAIVNDYISQDPINADTDRIDRAVEARLTQMALDIDFDSIKVNEALKLKSGGIVVVVEKTDDKLVVRKFGESQDMSTFEIKKSEVKNKILYKDQPFVETLKKTDPEVDQQTQDTSNENLNKAQELNTTDSVREDMDSVQNMTQDEVDNDFENSLGCKR